MSYEQVLSTASATVGVLVLLLTLGLARAPGCKGLQWLGVIAFSAGGISALRTMAESVATDREVALVTQLAMALTGVMLWAWVRYEASGSDRPRRWTDAAFSAGALAVACLALVPSLLVTTTVVRHRDGWSSVVYVDALPTALGIVVLLTMLSTALLLTSRYVRRWRRGEPLAGAQALGLGGLLAASIHEIVDGVWIHGGMHLMPVGLLWTIGCVGVALVGRFVHGAEQLVEVTVKLEQAMRERDAELATARADLVETRQLATLGRLSAAVAHEINNPVAVVAANVGYLRDALPAVAPGVREAGEAIGDTLASVDRIAAVVGQLLEAGQLASRGTTVFPVGVATTVAAAVATARGRRDEPAPVEIDVDAALHVSSQDTSLRQVLASLIHGSLEALRVSESAGGVRVIARRDGDRVELRVEDDAPEEQDVLRERRFKPYLDTDFEIVRDDVGLSVSLALVRMLGAEIVLERSDESGSVVRIELRAAEAPAAQSEPPVSSRHPRAHILIVDDDPLTRIGLRRLLGREFVVEEAGTVADALEVIRRANPELDAIVCDVVMPDGGAEALITALGREAPRLAAAVVVLTGGVVAQPPGSRLESYASRTLRKPVDLTALRTMIERVRVHRPSAIGRSGQSSS
jgi:signal transduction histidine kinase/ActR/RegA family two-component response regulator